MNGAIARAVLAGGALASVQPLHAAPKAAAPIAEECRPSKIQRLDALLGGNRFGKFVQTPVGRAGMSAWDKANALGGKVIGAVSRTLKPDEQKQADAASTIAVCQGIPGREIRWTSTTRANVTGTSTVTALNSDARLGRCITVRDIVIVDGTESRTEKRMCRAPGAPGYTRAA